MTPFFLLPGLVMKVKVRVLFVCVFLCLLGPGVVTHTRAESANSNILYVGGSGLGNFSLIQDAIDNASTGDIVYVFSGVYRESLVISKTIFLCGEDRMTTVVNGSKNDAVVNVTEEADRVVVSGFTLTSALATACVYLASDANTISDNILCNMEGIIIERQRDGSVSRNNTISSNNFLTWYSGISIEDSFWNTISANSFHGGQVALALQNSTVDTISGNTFLQSDGILVLDCVGSRVFENVIVNPTDKGISIIGCSNTVVHDNSIVNGSDNGITVDLSSSVSVYSNHVEGNAGFGISVFYSSLTVVVGNNIFNNKLNGYWVTWASDFFFHNNRWYNNYWGHACMSPKTIPGIVYFGRNIHLPLFCLILQIDLKPASTPYMIPTNLTE
jgi:parallel beta-helix repeat protein